MIPLGAVHKALRAVRAVAASSSSRVDEVRVACAQEHGVLERMRFLVELRQLGFAHHGGLDLRRFLTLSSESSNVRNRRCFCAQTPVAS